MNDILWISLNEKVPAPGLYLTRRVTRVTQYNNGRRTIAQVIQPARWTGEKWIPNIEPTDWREMPEKAGK